MDSKIWSHDNLYSKYLIYTHKKAAYKGELRSNTVESVSSNYLFMSVSLLLATNPAGKFPQIGAPPKRQNNMVAMRYLYTINLSISLYNLFVLHNNFDFYIHTSLKKAIKTNDRLLKLNRSDIYL